MKKSRLKKALVITLLISLLCTNVALANGNETNMKNLGLIDSKFNINSDVMKKIENALSLKPDLINYFNGSIKIFNNGIHTNSSDYNQYLSDMVDAALYVKKAQDNDIKNVNSKILVQNKSVPADVAIAAYNVGIKKVKDRGCKQTALYMEHARDIVSQSGNGHYNHNGDAWAKLCATNTELFYKVTAQFEDQILATGKTWGIVSGDFAFTTGNSSLDQYTALHNVHYAVTFNRMFDGTYSASYDIGDIYDFAWGNYNSIEIGFGNNYCYAMQELGLIKTFGIDIYWNY